MAAGPSGGGGGSSASSGHIQIVDNPIVDDHQEIINPNNNGLCISNSLNAVQQTSHGIMYHPLNTTNGDAAQH